MRELRVVPADDAGEVLVALRQALGGDGPAMMPVAHGVGTAEIPVEIPVEVPQRIALVVQTSGSTGTPKRVALSADALLASAAASEAALGAPGQWLLALPAHYIAGINVLARSITAGTDPVILPSGHFDPLAFATAAVMMQHPVRFTSLVPAQLARLVETDAALDILRRFNRILVGGQSTPIALLAQALELGLNVTHTYGSSETAGGCVYDGVPIGSATVRIIDEQVELGGPTLAEGYLGDDAQTTERFFVDGGARWYRTGDAGQLADGVLHITGRLDDVIISGGLKVSLAAIERVVHTVPGLADAVVITRADAQWGTVPVVVTTTSVSLDQVRQAVAVALGPAARPAAIVVVETIPLLASGKPDRQALTAR